MLAAVARGGASAPQGYCPGPSLRPSARCSPLLPWRHHGRRRPTPSHHGRLGVHGEPLLWRRRRRAHVATKRSPARGTTRGQRPRELRRRPPWLAHAAVRARPHRWRPPAPAAKRVGVCTGPGLPRRLQRRQAGSRAATNGSATGARSPPPSDWFWRAVPCGQDEAPSCTTAAAPREAGANSAPALDRRRRPTPGDPYAPAREGPPAPGVWGQRPHEE